MKTFKILSVLLLVIFLSSCGTTRLTTLTKYKEGHYTTTEGDSLFANHSRIKYFVEEGGKFRIWIDKKGKIYNCSFRKNK